MKYSPFYCLFAASCLLPLLSFANEEKANQHLPVGARESVVEKKKESSSNFLINYYPPVYYGPAEHCIVGVSAFGDTLEIEDGSQWKIAPYDKAKTSNWGMQDPILITQNHTWFSPYNYRIVNPATQSSIEANLFLGPIQNGAYTRYVMSIYPIQDSIILNDQTRWKICSFDLAEFQEWRPQDAIIIGYNSGWNASYCQGLLINVTLNQCVRAEQY